MSTAVRLPGLAVAAMASFLLAAYMLTMAPSYTFEDTPLFTAACRTLGVPHPPGYPLWVLGCAPFEAAAGALGHAPGVGAALFSALAATAGCCVLARLCMQACGHAPAAIAAAIAAGLGLTFWSQAVIQEAYALNFLLVVISLDVAGGYARGGSPHRLTALALLAGLGLANHWPLFALGLPAVALTLAPATGRVLDDLNAPRAGLTCLAALALGLLPYAHLLAAPPGGARFLGATPADGLWDFISRAQFAAQDAASQHPRWDQRIRDAGLSTWWVFAAHGNAIGLLAIAGIVSAWRRLDGWQLAALAWLLLGTTVILALYRPFLAVSEISAQTFRNYGLTASIPVAVTMACLLGSQARRLAVPPTVIWSVVVVVAVILAAAHGPRSHRGTDDLAPRHAAAVVAALPHDVTYVIGTGNFDFPLTQRVHLAAGPAPRPLPLAWLLDEEPGVPLPDLVARLPGPVAISPAVEGRLPGVGWQGTHGLRGAGATAPLSARARQLLEHAAVVGDSANNIWTRTFADRMLFATAWALRVQQATVGPLPPADARLLAIIDESRAGRFARFLALIGGTAGLAPGRLETAVNALGDLDGYPVSWRADVRHITAMSYLARGNTRRGMAILERALEEFPAATNRRVLVDLLALHAREGNFERYAWIRRRYPALAATGLDSTDAQCGANLGRDCTR